MNRFDPFRRRLGADRLGRVALLVATSLTAWGCSGPATDGSSAEETSLDGSGLQLPPDFEPVELPVEQRKEIFREAHLVRAKAVQEANRRLPMDEAHLPIGDTEAFDARVAEHKAIIDELLEQNLADLAARYEISLEDLARIEQEAGILRWLPPEDPVPEEAPAPEEEPESADSE